MHIQLRHRQAILQKICQLKAAWVNPLLRFILPTCLKRVISEANEHYWQVALAIYWRKTSSSEGALLSVISESLHQTLWPSSWSFCLFHYHSSVFFQLTHYHSVPFMICKCQSFPTSLLLSHPVTGQWFQLTVLFIKRLNLLKQQLLCMCVFVCMYVCVCVQ